jgi:5-methylthioadenosine/S-adenosylhomocysteine deaminase
MREVDFVITGGIVLVMDENNSIISNGAVAIDGPDIAAVGHAEKIAMEFKGRRSIDARGSLVMPGLVNGHTHAAMTCFRGIADDLTLMDWRPRIGLLGGAAGLCGDDQVRHDDLLRYVHL